MILDAKKNKIVFLAIAAAFFALAYFLNLVFSGRLILPQAFYVGPINIRYYGIIMALAALAGFMLAKKRAAIYGIASLAADDLIFWMIIGGFVGARIYHVLSSWPYYIQHPLDALKVWQGGLSIFGAMFGGVIALVFLKRIFRLKSPVLSLLDWLAPSLLLGQIIGRFGNLFNYEAFGYPANLPWKMFVPLGFRPLGFETNLYFQPLFLYEALGNAVILVFLLKSGKNLRPGALFFIYLLLYNILRFFLEFMRTDSTFIHGVRLNSITSLVLAVLSLGYLVFARHAKQT